ncbi:hypothetical protein PAECIP112173_00796 [Paenibacillus sp. JJ-100]|uniref:hypothetical protein n=1 Tax=Paenibacillus sp. JJ-100 TaxID=2974896 RepID=UPI0022FF8BB7|nr:hypothetical protein [Paenibacillus sp. JJ-100]CAI6035276.1 hypothetical protein PAECIP112173_00796 [Paenibacillus sp. JJ-100]
MSESILVLRIKNRLGSKDVNTVILKQKEIKIIVKEELGHLLLIDADDCNEMFLLASLFHHSMKSHDVIYLEREDTRYTDLFIFNGAINPLTQKELRKIKSSIEYCKPVVCKLPLINTHDETVWDTWKHWKYDEELRIKADKDMAIINSSQLGFELLVNSCAYLATSYVGHSHFDCHSTKTSPELIIRNIARN